MFCIVLTGSALATGIAAPPAIGALGEQPRRAEAIDTHGDGRSPCISRLASAQLRPSLRLSPAVPRRPSRGHALSLAGNGVYAGGHLFQLRYYDSTSVPASLNIEAVWTLLLGAMLICC